MDCRECQQLIDDLLVAAPSEAANAELAEHVAACPSCAREHRLAGQALAALAPPLATLNTRALRQRILSTAATMAAAEKRTLRPTEPSWVLRYRRYWAPLAAAASVAAVAGMLEWRQSRNGAEHAVEIPAFTLVSRAYAAEAAIFAADSVVHLVNEIVVKPVGDAQLAAARWYPIESLDASGKPRIHQLTLPASDDKEYVIIDECWYEPATGRFTRQLTDGGRPVFANSFDGQSVYWLNLTEGGARVEKTPIAADFQPPVSPASLLGIVAGLPAEFDESKQDLVTDAGPVVLKDGAAARQVRMGFKGLSENRLTGYALVTIRDDDNTIARIEMMAGDKPMYELRRIKTERLASAAIAWNLADLDVTVAEAPAELARIVPDVVKKDVSLADMVLRASFPTYVFKSAPAWAPTRQIADVLDVASPPKRMFFIVYSATDGRHVVLVQALTYNQIRQAGRDRGKVIYTSPGGVKVYSGAKDKWLAGLLLQSARAWVTDPPAEDRTGYLLETPEGTSPALAINGKVSDEELHLLIDSLTPAKGAH